MKKHYIIMFAFLALFSCEKQNIIQPVGPSAEPISTISFNLDAIYQDGTITKAVKTGWENGDVIYVFFSGASTPKYLKMSYDGASWTKTEMDGEVEGTIGLMEGSTGTMRAVFLPFGSNATVSANGTEYVFGETFNTYYLTATLDYQVVDGSVSGTFVMTVPEGYIQFFIDDPNADSSTIIELRERHLTPQGIASIAADGNIIHTSFAHGAPLKGYVYDKSNKTSSDAKGYLFSGILADEARNVYSDYYFTIVRGGWDGAYFRVSYTDKKLYTGNSSGRAVKLPVLSKWDEIFYHKPIDMCTDVDGKRIYWSDCNLGATAPKEIGDFFAWGVTEPYYLEGHSLDNPNEYWKDGMTKGYHPDTYPWGGDKVKKYCPENMAEYWGGDGNPDNKMKLDLEDDAAAHTLKGNWRIPTNDDFMALLSVVSWYYEIDNNSWVGAGKERLIINAPNGSSIILPITGHRSGTKVWQTEYGRYWSANLNDTDYSEYYYFNNPSYIAYCLVVSYWVGSPSLSTLNRHARSIGNPIRPVTE